MSMNLCPWCDAVFSSATKKPKRCPSCKRTIEYYEDMQPNDPNPDEPELTHEQDEEQVRALERVDEEFRQEVRKRKYGRFGPRS